MEKITARPRDRDRVQARARDVTAVTARPKQRESASAHRVDTLFEQNGWQKQSTPRGEVYTGQYRVWDERAGQQRLYAGRIEVTGGQSTAWIQNPPRELLSEHPKRACFLYAGDGWHWMNWYRGTPDIDRTIGYVTRVLAESVNRSWQQ